MARDSAKPRVSGPVEEPRSETVTVEVEAEPESEADVALLGSQRKVTLKAHTAGDTTKVRILRACNIWADGDEPTINAAYAAKLIANGLAETIPERRRAPKGKAAKP